MALASGALDLAPPSAGAGAEEGPPPIPSDEYFAASVVSTPPGVETYVTAELEPGRYVAICFVPEGATPEAMASGAVSEEGAPHVTHGMVTEFEVG